MATLNEKDKKAAYLKAKNKKKKKVKRPTPYEDRMGDRSRMKRYGQRPKGNTLGYDWRKSEEDFEAETRRIGDRSRMKRYGQRPKAKE
tara:strand:+ start:516 stop:779 length:264 start_codon:yes stop_codon:yes gene_type:complete